MRMEVSLMILSVNSEVLRCSVEESSRKVLVLSQVVLPVR